MPRHPHMVAGRLTSQVARPTRLPKCGLSRLTTAIDAVEFLHQETVLEKSFACDPVDVQNAAATEFAEPTCRPAVSER